MGDGAAIPGLVRTGQQAGGQQVSLAVGGVGKHRQAVSVADSKNSPPVGAEKSVHRNLAPLIGLYPGSFHL